MAGKSSAVSGEYKLKADFGSGPGTMVAGQLVAVTGVFKPGTPGLGMSDEDVVMADFLDIDRSPRTIALPLSEFTARFERVT